MCVEFNSNVYTLYPLLNQNANTQQTHHLQTAYMPVISYASPIWATGNTKRLESFQNAVHRRYTKSPRFVRITIITSDTKMPPPPYNPPKKSIILCCIVQNFLPASSDRVGGAGDLLLFLLDRVVCFQRQRTSFISLRSSGALVIIITHHPSLLEYNFS